MPVGIFPILIIIATAFFSYRGFKNIGFYSAHVFEVEKILVFKQYKRILTSGLLHVNWLHLIFNLLALFFFSGAIEMYLGPLAFLLIYVASLAGGNLLALFIHRLDGSYSAVGASGGVNGIIFATIALFPYNNIYLLFIGIPGWIFGLLYIALSIWGIRSRRDNVGHEAHLGGALIGMFIALLMVPSALVENLLPVLALVVPTITFIALIVYKPHLLMVDNLFYKKNRSSYTIDQRYNLAKKQKQQDIDRILEKIHRRGLSSLSKEERRALDEYSKQ